MAYILGFVSADGNVYHTTICIDIAPKDIEVLEFIKKCICPDTKINAYHNGQSRSIKINSVEMVDSLIQFNIVPRKSASIRADYDIPKDFIGDYVRGIFDGDGWVYCRRNSIECGICSASNLLLEDLQSKCNGIGRIRERYKNSDRRNSLYCWEMWTNDAVSLRDLMYANDCFSLHRKKDKFFSQYYVKSHVFWVDEQIDYLINHWNEPLQMVGDAINRSRKAVSKKKWELRVAKDERIMVWEKKKKSP